MIYVSCKELSGKIARGEYDGSWGLLRLHLTFCWFCRRYKAQLDFIARGFREAWPAGDTGDFKKRLVERLAR